MTDTSRAPWITVDIAVAKSGRHVERDDRCSHCGTLMLYVCDEDGRPVEMFCEEAMCRRFLVARRIA